MAAPGPDKSSKKKTEKKLAAHEEAKLLASFMGVMNTMRKQKTLCDVILMVQDRKIPAHRVVLASASHFFNLMFTSKCFQNLLITSFCDDILLDLWLTSCLFYKSN